MEILEVTVENFDEKVLNSEKPVMLDFWATWCGPCQMQAPIFHAFAEKHADTAVFGKVNVDEQMELCLLYTSQILLLTAACSFLQNFIHVFENSQISKTGFYLYFLLLMGLLLRSYLLIHGILEDVLGQVIDFMEALLPAFCMTMVFCSQKVTAVGFYQLSLIVIYLIDRVLLYIVIPAIHVYVVLQMLNCMTEEKLISRMTVLLKRGLIWVMRLLLAGVTGMNVIERMIAPSVDNLKKMSVTQTISMLPGLGNTAQAVGNIFFGSAVVIRNGIGTAAMIVLVCLSLIHILKRICRRLYGIRQRTVGFR